jgi:hypothetical protein
MNESINKEGEKVPSNGGFHGRFVFCVDLAHSFRRIPDSFTDGGQTFESKKSGARGEQRSRVELLIISRRCWSASCRLGSAGCSDRTTERLE